MLRLDRYTLLDNFGIQKISRQKNKDFSDLYSDLNRHNKNDKIYAIDCNNVIEISFKIKKLCY